MIRGASSISGNNQPLFIVDGIPVDNSAPSNSGYGGIDYGNLVQDMVNYSKQRKPSYQLSDVNQVVLNAVAFARERARENGIQVTELVDPTIGAFQFDPQGIERCVMNLISNAIDAAPDAAGSGVASERD